MEPREWYARVRASLLAAVAAASLASCWGSPGSSVPTSASSPTLQAVVGTHAIDPAAAARFRALRGQHPASLSTGIAAGVPKKTHAFWAIWPDPGNTGIQARQILWPKLIVTQDSDVIYAPTTYPARNACIESTTAYQSATYGGLQIWAWNWCTKGGQVGRAIDVDAAFLAKYTRAAGTAREYDVRIVQTDAATNQWTDYLYNFRTTSWNVFFVSQAKKAAIREMYGWDAYETYSKIDPKTGISDMCGYVGGIGPIVSKDLRLLSPAGWSDANPKNSFVAPDGNFYCPLDFRVPVANSEYSVSPS